MQQQPTELEKEFNVPKCNEMIARKYTAQQGKQSNKITFQRTNEERA
jgi:hypothetical protein